MTREMTPGERERFRHLLVQAVDGELDAEGQAEFEGFLKNYPECRQEWQQFKRVKEVTRTMKFKNPSEEVWDTYWLNVYNRLERGLGWILFSVGAIILVTYGLYQAVLEIFRDTQLPVILKLGMLGVIGGGVILLISVAREKLKLRKSDRYREVKR